MNINKIKHILKSANRIAVICHKNPDGDALGSQAGLAGALSYWQKEYTLFCTTPAPAHFNWLPNIDKLINQTSVITDNKFDVVVLLDSGSLTYAGVEKIIENLPYQHTIINIDHHNSNTGFGNINYVDEYSSSTCEIIYELLRQWRIPITKDISTNLLNGIMTDTGMLTNPATSDKTLTIAGKLMKFGANIYKISQYNLRNKNTAMLNLWGTAMQRLVYNKELSCASTYITKEEYVKYQLEEGGLNGLANFLSSLDDIDFTMVLIETPDGLIKGSLRTTLDNVNVGELAKKLGGGGHKKAAGFVIKGKLFYNDNEIKIT